VIVGCVLWPFRQCPELRNIEVRAAALACKRATDGLISTFSRGSDPPDAYALKIKEVQDVMREGRSRALMQFIVFWSVVFALSGSFSLHMANVWGDPEVDDLRAILTESPYLRLLCISLCVVFTPVKSFTRNATSVELLYFSLSMASQWLMTDLAHYERNSGLIAVARLMFAAVLGRPRFENVLSALHMGCLFAQGLADEALSQAIYEGARLLPLYTLIAVVSERAMYSDARATVEAMSSARSEAAVHELLSIVCDSVVLLDENMYIASPSPTFDALLLRSQRPSESLEYFPSHLHAADRARFLDFVAGDDTQTSLRVCLTDGGGLRLGAQLLHKRFEDAAGHTRHLVGIQEELDVTTSPAQAALRTSRRSPSSSASVADDSTSSASDFVNLCGPGEDGIVVWIDTCSPNLRVMSCSASCLLLTGPMEDGADFVDYISTRDRRRLVEWMCRVRKHQEGMTSERTTDLASVRFARNKVSGGLMCTVRAGACESGGVQCFHLTDLTSRRRDATRIREVLKGTSSIPRRRMTL